MTYKHKRPEIKHTFWKGFSFAFMFVLIGGVFFSNILFIALLIFIGFAVAIFEDYFKGPMRQRAIEVLRSKVEVNKSGSNDDLAKQTSHQNYDINKYTPDASKSSSEKNNTTEALSPDFPVINIDTFIKHTAGTTHRFDYLMKYRIAIRLVVSALLVLAMLIALTKLMLTPNQELSDGKIFLIVLSLCVLLEYNISYLRRKPTAGLFFRENFKHTPSMLSQLEGEEKERFSLAGNKFGVGSGIYGRPIFGIFLCVCWLIAIDNRHVNIAFFIMFVGSYYLHRRKFDKSSPPLHLLELRVFESSSFGSFLELLQAWQYIGLTYRLDGPDTFGHKFSQIIPLALNKIDKHIVKNKQELANRFRSFKEKRSRFFDQYDVHTMQCTDDTWELAIREAITRCDCAVMLLSGFNSQRTGCTTELNILAQTYPYEQTFLLIDNNTVVPHLAKLLSSIRSELSPESPNYATQCFPHIINIDEIYDIEYNKRTSMVAIKMQLVDYINSVLEPVLEAKRRAQCCENSDEAVL